VFVETQFEQRRSDFSGFAQKPLYRFDHATFVVRDMEEAVRFFGVLGFQVDLDVMIAGETLGRYMGIKDLEARHVTLVLVNSPVCQEVQLVNYSYPNPIPDPHIGNLNKLGYKPWMT
jgi:hypothetical protein